MKIYILFGLLAMCGWNGMHAQTVFPVLATDTPGGASFALIDNITADKMQVINGVEHLATMWSGYSKATVMRGDTLYCGYMDVSGAYRLPLRHVAQCSDMTEGSAALGVYTPAGVRYGFMKPSGQWAIAPRFLEAQPFSEGVAAVRDSATGKWGYVRKSVFGWEWIIKPSYLNCAPFRQGVAAVTFDGKLYGFVNPQGFLVIEPQFVRSGEMVFREHKAVVKRPGVDSVFAIDKVGKALFALRADTAFTFSENKLVVGLRQPDGRWNYGVWDENGHCVLRCQFALLAGPGGKGYTGGIWATSSGLLDVSGNLILPFSPETIWAGVLHNNLILIAETVTELKGKVRNKVLHRDGRILWQSETLGRRE